MSEIDETVALYETDETVETNETAEMVATDEATETVETDETTEVTDSAKQSGKRGRPRPEDVVQRDEEVFAVITGSMTRKQIADVLSIKESHVYLSLLRLRNAGRLQHERNGMGHTWSRTQETAVVA